MKRSGRLLALGAALFAGGMAVSSAFAQGKPLEVYVAYLGSDDHYNSRGARLSEPWQVIRQDRANFQRFGLRDSNGDAR